MTTTTTDRPRFVCGYRGETEYDIGGEKYATRYWASNEGPYGGHYNGDYFAAGILPFVGTVRCLDAKKFGEFPPAHIVALFPGFVAARYPTGADGRIMFHCGAEYCGDKPMVDATDPTFVKFINPTEEN